MDKNKHIDTAKIDAIIPNPSDTPDVVSISGFPGKSLSADHIRVYDDLESLNRHLEIARADIVHVEPKPDGASTLLVRADANVSAVEIVKARELPRQPHKLRLRAETIANLSDLALDAGRAAMTGSRDPFCSGNVNCSRPCAELRPYTEPRWACNTNYSDCSCMCK